jgi:DNA polymerase-3 subunit beta
MKVLVGRNELLAALQCVIGVVERRQTLPVLANFLLETRDDELVVTGTDLEMELVSIARVQNLTPGRVTVPARKLFDICRGLPEGADVSLQVADDKLTLRSGKSRFSLSTLKADEYPTMGSALALTTLELQRKQLKALLERSMFAMAQQDVRYYLNGLLLELTPKRVRAVATDGHRLALSELALDTGVDAAHQAILPRKSVTELARLLDTTELPVKIEFGQGQVRVDFDTVQLTTKTIDGRFPDYERVIPEGGDKRVIVDREGLRKALARAAILSNEKFRGVRLMLESGSLKLQTHNPEHEEAEDEVAVEYSGASMEIGFNVNYLLDALGVMGGEKITMELKNSDQSGLLHEVDDRSSRYVIMPMRL